MKISRILRVVGLAAALIATGCGGDDELTREEFTAQAEALCASAGDDIDERGEEMLSDQPNAEELGEFFAEVTVPLTQELLDDLRELRPPSEDEDQVDAFLDATQDGVDTLRDDPEGTAETLLGGGEIEAFDQADQLAEDYGLEDCAY